MVSDGSGPMPHEGMVECELDVLVYPCMMHITALIVEATWHGIGSHSLPSGYLGISHELGNMFSHEGFGGQLLGIHHFHIAIDEKKHRQIFIDGWLSLAVNMNSCSYGTQL